MAAPAVGFANGSNPDSLFSQEPIDDRGLADARRAEKRHRPLGHEIRVERGEPVLFERAHRQHVHEGESPAGFAGGRNGVIGQVEDLLKTTTGVAPASQTIVK